MNGGKPLWVAEHVLAACQGIEAPVIACLGLAYKADVGDLRESRAIAVIERLQKTCPGSSRWRPPSLPHRSYCCSLTIRSLSMSTPS